MCISDSIMNLDWNENENMHSYAHIQTQNLEFTLIYLDSTYEVLFSLFTQNTHNSNYETVTIF